MLAGLGLQLEERLSHIPPRVPRENAWTRRAFQAWLRQHRQAMLDLGGETSKIGLFSSLPGDTIQFHYFSNGDW